MARVLGLDIGNNMVRGALAQSRFGKVEVLAYLESPVVAQESSESEMSPQAEAIQALVRNLGTPPDTVMTCIPGDATSLRTLELPRVASKRLTAILPYELENLVPFSLEETVIDYQPIQTGPQSIHVLVAAAPKLLISEQLEMLRTLRLDPKEITVSPVAMDGLTELVPDLRKSGTHGIIHVDEERTDVTFMQSGHIVFARSLSVARADWSRSSENVGTLLKQTFLAYRSSYPEAPMVLWLSGTITQEPEALGWLAQLLSTEVRILPLPDAPGAHEWNRPAFARAAALVARSILRGKHLNLRQGDMAMQQTMGALRERLPLALGCLGMLFLAYGFSAFAQLRTLEDERVYLQGKLETLSQELLGESTTDFARAQELLENKSKSSDPLPRFDAFDALTMVSERIPTDIKHDSRLMHIELGWNGAPGRFELEGTVSSIGERDRVASELQRVECFQKIEKGRASAGVGNDRLNYAIEATLLCPWDAGKKKKSASLKEKIDAP